MARKRTATEAVGGPTLASRRRSGRLSGTPQKSKYFEASDDDAADSDSSPPPKKKTRGRPRIAKQVPRDQDEDDDKDAYKNESEGSDNFEADEDEDKDEDEYEHEDEDEEQRELNDGDDSADDEDARPRVKVIPLEKMRDTGGVEYENGKLHKNTMLFLRDLKANNVRSWLKCE